MFAVGSVYRRCVDWLDVLLPEAWNVEHGRLHHYSLNEANDPDLVEKNVAFLRNLQGPKALKYLIAAFFAFTWKLTYYSSNTYSMLLFTDRMKEANSLSEQLKELDESKRALENDPKAKLLAEKEKRKVVTLFTLFDGSAPSWWNTMGFLREVVVPYFFVRFIVVPLPFAVVLGKQYYVNALINLMLADFLTNVHSFITIVTNHAGSDLYWFEDHCEPNSDEFFLRQIIGSADFSAGNDFVDFWHGFLNYQVSLVDCCFSFHCFLLILTFFLFSFVHA